MHSIVALLLAAGVVRRFGADKRWQPLADGTPMALGSGLAAGVRASPDAGGWLIALADMPFVAVDTLRAVQARLHAGASLVAPTHHGRRGHPVGFAANWFTELATLNGDTGARQLLREHADQLELLAVDDPGVLADIDRPVDLEEPPASRVG